MFGSVDVETTGTIPGYHEIVQIAIAPYSNTFERVGTPFCSLVRPEFPDRFGCIQDSRWCATARRSPSVKAAKSFSMPPIATTLNALSAGRPHRRNFQRRSGSTTHQTQTKKLTKYITGASQTR